jgi:outer membrane lipoprotein-sorting protein
MSRALLRIVLLAGCFSLVSLAATAQEVVHALTGIVNNINSAAKTIAVITDDGSDGIFQDMTGSRTSIEFDKNIRTEATAADEFKKKGARVIVFYYGAGDVRTVVAIKSLGEGPFMKDSGTVVKFDKKEHSLTIKDSSGAIESFKITSSTVADTDAGAAEGLKFDPHKGESVRVIATQTDGSLTALFINGALAL